MLFWPRLRSRAAAALTRIARPFGNRRGGRPVRTRGRRQHRGSALPDTGTSARQDRLAASPMPPSDDAARVAAACVSSCECGPGIPVSRTSIHSWDARRDLCSCSRRLIDETSWRNLCTSGPSVLSLSLLLSGSGCASPRQFLHRSRMRKVGSPAPPHHPALCSYFPDWYGHSSTALPAVAAKQ